MKNSHIIKIGLLVFSFAILFSHKLYGQACDTNGAGLYFTKQSEVDNFSLLNPNCDRVDGNLIIDTEIENLKGLAQLKSIGGSLRIDDNKFLVNLEGLDNVQRIGGDIVIEKCEKLNNLQGLENLEVIEGNLIIDEAPALLNLDGLNDLDSIYGDMKLEEIPNSNSMAALAGLEYIGGEMRIVNSGFQTMVGLGGIQTFYGDVLISDNSDLDSLKGLERLMEIKGDFTLKRNADFQLFGRPRIRMGTYKLENIGGDFLVEQCRDLGSMLGLDDLDEIGGDLALRRNESLLHITNLLDINHIGADIQISECDNLSDLNGLNGLIRAHALSISSNEDLSSLFGIHNIIEVAENVFIGGNPSLLVISGGLIPGGGGSHRFLGLKHVGGSLSITEPNTVSMLGFYNVETIGGGLSLTTTMYNIFDFRHLESVGGTFFLTNNFNLKEIDFDSLGYVGGFLLEDNPSLGSFFGLSELQHIGEAGLTIYDDNDALRSFYGLEKLAIIEGDLKLHRSDIFDFTGWNGAGGLSSLESIGGSLIATDNIRLRSFAGLSSLESIGGHFLIITNPDLIGIGGLYELERLDSTLEISHNRFLMSLVGLDNIDYNGITELTITDNGSLSLCEVESICNYLDLTSKPKNIGGNAEGCNSEMEVEEACNAVSTDNYSKLSELVLIPNPADSQLKIRHDEDLEIQYVIVNVLHQVVDSGIGNTIQPLDIGNFDAGVYFLYLKWEEEVAILEFIKQ